MFAEQCGMKTPKTLQTGDDHRELHLKSLPQQFVLKPSNFWNSAKVIRDKGICEVVSIDTIMGIPTGIGYFCEEYIKGYETNISYIMSEGDWSFTFSEHCDESKEKEVNGGELYTHGLLIQL